MVGSPKVSDKIPAIEQTLSAGEVALSLLNAALAAGWGASWLTGWPAYDRTLVEGELGLGAGGVDRRLRLHRHLRDAAAGPAAAGRGGADHLGRGVSLVVDLGRALAQLGDPRFLRVLLRALALTVAALAAVFWAVMLGARLALARHA